MQLRFSGSDTLPKRAVTLLSLTVSYIESSSSTPTGALTTDSVAVLPFPLDCCLLDSRWFPVSVTDSSQKTPVKKADSLPLLPTRQYYGLFRYSFRGFL